MFGKTKESAVVTAGKSVNLFAEGTFIKGDIKTLSDIRIDGTVEGAVVSDAKVVVGPAGKITGQLTCQNADISGYIQGTIEVGELLFLKSTAVIEGNITTEKLVVEAGAVFNGHCQMGQKWISPQRAITPQYVEREASVVAS